MTPSLIIFPNCLFFVVFCSIWKQFKSTFVLKYCFVFVIRCGLNNKLGIQTNREASLILYLNYKHCQSFCIIYAS